MEESINVSGTARVLTYGRIHGCAQQIIRKNCCVLTYGRIHEYKVWNK